MGPAGALHTIKPAIGRPGCQAHVLQALHFAPQSKPCRSLEPSWHFPTLSPQELIDHESVDSLTSVMRQQAMLAIMKLSKVKPPLWVLTQPSLLSTCFSSIFSLPPAQTMEEVEADLYTKTLKTMDKMLKALVCKDQEPNLLMLQNILEVWRHGGRKGTSPVAGVGLRDQGSI
ncbi:maestro heat-like repeat-containing protein family member 7 [Pangshura tecta]